MSVYVVSLLCCVYDVLGELLDCVWVDAGFHLDDNLGRGRASETLYTFLY